MRCAVYVRVSTEMEAQNTSIAHQISFFDRYIQDKGWTLVELYKDRESGTTIRHREGLKKLMEDSQKNHFDMVLTKSISRFARNTLEGLQLARKLKEKDIRLITIEDGFDSDEYDEFMFTLLLSIAQKESEKMSQRIQFGKLSRAKEGLYNGSTPPYGYTKTHVGTLIPAQDISKYVVEKIFNMYLDGKGIYSIAKELNSSGYPTPSNQAGKRNSGCTWHQSTVRKILSNRIYVGDMVQNKSSTQDVLWGKRKMNKEDKFICLENTHEGIIDKDIFNRVQEMLKMKRRRKQSQHIHLFSNILHCGLCGSGMHYKKDKEAYLCGKTNKMGKVACPGVYIREEVIKKALNIKLKEIMGSINIESIKESITKKFKDDFQQNKIKEIQIQIHRNNIKKQKVLDLFIENIIDKENYTGKLKELESESKILWENKEKLERHRNTRLEDLKTMVNKILQMDDVDNLFITSLIQEIRVMDKKKLEIIFDFTIN